MTASNSTSNKKRSVINFEKARLILVDKTLSYVELNSPDDFATRCLLCNKTNDHDHDIIGKMKFEPKHKSYLVSLVEKKKLQNSTASKSGSLDIIPLNNKKTAASTPAEKRLENSNTNENLIRNAEENENAKPSQHVYPVTVPDEATGNKSLRNKAFPGSNFVYGFHYYSWTQIKLTQ